MIQVLNKSVADKIAAGEVVDRPLSIVKELVENSIDAGASSILVEIQKGGKSYIRVTDDGCGIPSDQVELAFQRHATSKITSAGDLEHIATLGFRGEALSSITAVSRTELVTKTGEEKTGTKLVIEGSQVAENSRAGCPEGTTIIVRDLFYNTPARLKFMKSDSAESSLIIDFISQVALAYPEIKIRLINNQTMLFSTQGRRDRLKNIMTVYGPEVGEGLLPIADQRNGLHLEGYISGPGQSKPTRRSQIFFINGRVVNSKVIEKGISQAYSDKLFEGRHPIAFLFLQTDPANLDVNIHPNKREVRFYDENVIVEFIRDVLRSALLTKESIPEVKKESIFQLKTNNNVSPPAKAKSDDPAPEKKEKIAKEEQVDIKKLLSNLREDVKTDAQPLTINEDKAIYDNPSKKIKPMPDAPQLTPKPFDFDQLEFTGSIFGTYITAVDDTCFYLIDQHAAHERVFFEQLITQYKQQEIARQPILVPIVVNVSYGTAENHYTWLDALNDMGFLIEEFGPKTYVVKELPAFVDLKEGEQFIKDFIDNIEDNTKLDTFPSLEKMIIRSCKSAVKAHDYLSREEIAQLMKDLKACENPFSCPHGRPTFIRMTQHEIEKLFKRV